MMFHFKKKIILHPQILKILNLISENDHHNFMYNLFLQLYILFLIIYNKEHHNILKVTI